MSAISVTGSATTAVSGNFSIYRGEDVTVTDTMSPATNITGWSLAFTVRKNYGDPNPALIAKTVGAGITITNATNGVFTIAIARADTASLTPGVYVYDVQRTDAGNETVLTIGYLTILPEVF